MNAMTVESDSKEEVLQEIAIKLWQARIDKFREGLRQIKGCGIRRLAVFTPAGIASVIFFPLLHKFGIMVKIVDCPGFFAIEFPVEDLFLPENQDKEINDIAFMRCSWDGRCYERLY